MKYLKEIEREYELTDVDKDNLKTISEKLLKYRDDFVRQFVEYLTSRVTMEYAKKEFFANIEKIINNWYLMLMSSNIDNDYIFKLVNASRRHIKFDISQDTVNAMVSFARRYLHEKMFQNFTNDVERKDLLITLHKIIDINYDILNRSYLEEKKKEYNIEYKFRGFVVKMGEKFSFIIQVVLISVLIVLTAIAAITVGCDLINLTINRAHELLISSLGSLLILWILAELIRTEIQLIKGGDFRISVFIGVALIAYIRDLLILTLQNNLNQVVPVYVLATIFILGLIYWLIYKAEKSNMVRRKI
jgi:uncharacterized membrane protein (DUF373 family)